MRSDRPAEINPECNKLKIKGFAHDLDFTIVATQYSGEKLSDPLPDESRRSSGGGASGGAKPVNKKTQSVENPPESIPKKRLFKQRKTPSINPTFRKNPTGQKRG